ncbi:MAG TPA: GNAT family N-acetyltransferase [Novosphingobium sp.]|nr:GNAT family N-acetyltransferase [Novosphingobium sp.]
MVEFVLFEQFEAAMAAAGQVMDFGRRTGAGLRLIRPDRLESADLAAWNDLAAAAQTPSAYAQPWFLLPALRHCDPAQGARLAVVEQADGSWAGVLPIARSATHGRSPLPNWHSWRHPNQFVSAPLVRTGCAVQFWGSLLEGLDERGGGELALCLADLPLDDPASDALFTLCAEENRTVVVDRRFERAALRGSGSAEPAPKLRRRLASLLRKLERERGAPQFTLIRDRAGIAAAVEQFLALEHSGWKGSCGSALACAPGTMALFADIMREGGQAGRVELASLRAGGEVLAFSTILVGEGRKYGFKMAYDERAAAYAPGLLLLNWITRSHQDSAAGLDFDSCSAPDQQPVSRLWPDRCAFADCRIALGGKVRQGALRAVMAGEEAYSWLKRLA